MIALWRHGLGFTLHLTRYRGAAYNQRASGPCHEHGVYRGLIVVEQRPARAFISYSWDSDEHREWVKRLAIRLRGDGVDAVLDRWHTVPGDQLPAFMESAVRNSEYVLAICTPAYKEKSDCRHGGVGYEGDIMTGEVLTTGNRRKFIPILRSGNWEEAAPSWLLGSHYVKLTGEPYSESAYRDLVDTILDRRELPPRVADARPRCARHNLPFIPRGFVGREEELRQLHAQLRPGEPVAITDQLRTAITGMGGIGKTQLAVYYAYQHLDEFETVCWVDAQGTDITAEFAALAIRPLALGRPSTERAEATAQVVRTVLAHGGPHLIIFDNVDDSGSFVRHIPASGQARVLVTSRRRDLQGVQCLGLGLLPPHEAISLLAGDQTFEGVERRAALALSEEVGRLTLALAVAARILTRPGRVPSTLLQRVRSSGILSWSEKAPPDHLFNKNPSLARLLDASWDLLNTGDPIDSLARRLLSVSGWFAPIGISPALLDAASHQVGAADGAVQDREDAVLRLVDLGLVELDEEGLVTLHRVVAEYARQIGGETSLSLFLRTMVGMSNRDLLETEITEAHRLVQHLRQCEQHDLNPHDRAAILVQLGELYLHVGDYAQSESSIRAFQHVEGASSALGSPRLADAMLTLGLALKEMGRFDEAVEVLREAVSFIDLHAECEAPLAAMARATLGKTIWTRGSPESQAEAERVLRDARELSSSTLGARHPMSAKVETFLGAVLLTEGPSREAISLLEHAHDTMATAGSESAILDVVETKMRLALALRKATPPSLPRVRTLLEESLEICAGAGLPDHHPMVAKVQSRLARALRDVGEIRASVDMAERAYNVALRTHGETHPATIGRKSRLAVLLGLSGDCETAILLAEDAYALALREYGTNHFRTRDARRRLESIRSECGSKK